MEALEEVGRSNLLEQDGTNEGDAYPEQLTDTQKDLVSVEAIQPWNRIGFVCYLNTDIP